MIRKRAGVRRNRCIDVECKGLGTTRLNLHKKMEIV
jgi:hypothetical protein